MLTNPSKVCVSPALELLDGLLGGLLDTLDSLALTRILVLSSVRIDR